MMRAALASRLGTALVAPLRSALIIGSATSPRALALARPDLPVRAWLLGPVLLGLAIGLALVALRFLPATSLLRALALGCALAAFLAGGYLLLPVGPAVGGTSARPATAVPANPLANDAGSPGRGQALFAANCVACHGASGRGDGPLAPTLLPRPANLRDAHMAGHRDTDLFGFISNGVPGSAMAPWRDRLTERERWDLVNYVRTFAPTAPAAAVTPVRASGTHPVARLTDAPVPDSLAGRLIYAAEGRLWSLDVAGGAPRDLTPERSRDTLAAEPALSPDGRTLAFTLIALPSLGAGAGAAPGTDLYLLDLRGGGQRLVLAHDQPAALIESPNWTPDGRALIYAYSAPVLTADGQLTGTRHEIQRLDLATGQRTTLVEDAFAPSLSPDGASLVYVASNPQTFETSLWIAGADGSARRQLVGAQGGFADFLAPRFAPGGGQIAFSVAGGPGVDPAPPSPSASGAARLWRWLIAPIDPPGAAAHGLPGDLWLVGRDGSDLHRLTALYEDQPIPAWSPDGGWIAILGGGGIYFLRSDGTALIRRSRTGGAGVLIWSELQGGSGDAPGEP